MDGKGMSGGFLDSGDNFLRGIKDIVGGDESEAAIGESLLARIDVVAFKAHDERYAEATCSLLAPPPTSRKLAGLPPAYWMMSIVAIANPAPLTRQAMLPSSPM